MRTRRAGVIILLLSAGALVVAAGLALLAHVSLAVQLIPVVISFPGLYIGWKAYQASRSDSAQVGLDQIASQLAESVGRQWMNELKVRELHEPQTVLPVGWDPAPAQLFESWASLLQSTTVSPGGPRTLPVPAPRQPLMSGSGRDLADILRRVPTHRLVILGEPGSGKTILLIRLLLDLLAGRQSGTLWTTAVPVLVRLASWNPDAHTLKQWLAQQITHDYPKLKDPYTSSTECTTTCAEALVNGGSILPILDGLDEIPEHVRDKAVSGINFFLTPGDPGLVLSCRVAEYSKALLASGTRGQMLRLSGALGVSLRPLEDKAIKDYFSVNSTRSRSAAQRWEPVIRALDIPAAPVAVALRTPLMVGLARAVYDPRLDEVADAE
jgi:hypothetical protein